MSMEMDHSFTVPVPPARAWDVLLDVEKIAPCMPGATVEEFDGEVVTGRIKVKVGPVSLTYRGTAKFTERDPDARVIVLEASGKETRGAGTASATVRASLEPESSGEATKVTMHTTMNVTGRPAQFGRGVMVEVGGKLVEKFADNLAQLISPGGATAADDAATDGRTAARMARAQTSPPPRRRPDLGAPNPRPSSPSRVRLPLRRASRTTTPSTWSGWSAPRSLSGSSRWSSARPDWPCSVGGCSIAAGAARRRNRPWTSPKSYHASGRVARSRTSPGPLPRPPDHPQHHLAHMFASKRWRCMILRLPARRGTVPRLLRIVEAASRPL